jgi:SAM-dependent methyltransferase
MAEITSGLRSILSAPLVYELVQRIFGAHAERVALVEDLIRPRPKDRILDIGCGPADILALMPDVHYVGYDPNPRYTESARARFGDRAHFFAGRFQADDVARHEPFDVGLLLGVLHHLDDGEAGSLLGLMRAAIRPGGRLITLDNVFVEDQNFIARKLIEWDRGKNVRTPAGYRSLTTPYFDMIAEEVIHKKMPPYTLFVMELAARASPRQ